MSKLVGTIKNERLEPENASWPEGESPALIGK